MILFLLISWPQRQYLSTMEQLENYLKNWLKEDGKSELKTESSDRDE